MSTHLTDAVCKCLDPPAKGNKITYDDEVSGFGCRVTKAGARSFVLTYRTRAGRERRYTIGSMTDWKVTAARERAKELRRDIDSGGDPLADLEALREAPTVDEFLDRFEKEHVSKKRPGTQTDYKSILEVHIRPHFGKSTKVMDVMPDDCDRLHRKITDAGHPYRANRVIAVLSKAFSLAIRWNMRDDNPCKGVEKNKEYQRRRYAKPHELAALVAALAAYPDQQIANALRLLLLTGARRGEVLAMRWADVDLTTATWSKPPSSTKQKEHHEVPLSAPARQLLNAIREALAGVSRRNSLPEFVFPGSGETGHIVEVKKAWRIICKSAGITGLRIHDLRHSFASQLVSGGASLPLIGALLGHSNPSTTQRYAHLFDDPQRAAVEKVGKVIVAAGKPKRKPKHVPEAAE